MKAKKRRKTDRRKRQHFATGSAMLNDRRWKSERRADRIDGRAT